MSIYIYYYLIQYIFFNLVLTFIKNILTCSVNLRIFHRLFNINEMYLFKYFKYNPYWSLILYLKNKEIEFNQIILFNCFKHLLVQHWLLSTTLVLSHKTSQPQP
jgi:hypothetical protein